MTGARVAVAPPIVRRLPSHNCWFGRPYGPPIAFVLHTESGGESGTVAEWLSSSSNLSAHYRAGLKGSLECWIDPADRAWSNGIVEPGNRWLAIARDCGIDPALNPNHVTVSCETEDLGNANQPVTELQYQAILCAAREATKRYPDSLRYLVSHADISPQSRPDCPGDRWLLSGRFEALARALDLKIME
jgi:N-acetyl-anhydromuramyl-L-alanine amidase AmpD